MIPNGEQQLAALQARRAARRNGKPPLEAKPPQRKRVRTQEEIIAVVAICRACPWFHLHEKVGWRCTHKDCECGQGSLPVDVAGLPVNGGLVNRITRAATRCPDGRW